MSLISATARLERLLASLREEQQRLGGSASTGKVLAAIQKVPEDDAVALNTAYIGMLALVRQAFEETAYAFAQPEDEDKETRIARVQRPLRSLYDSIASNSIHSPVSTITQHQPQELELLTFAVARLATERELPNEVLEGVKRGLDEVLREVLNSDLDETFQDLFAAGIRHLQHAIDDYRIYGPDAVTKAYGEVVASTVALAASRTEQEKAKASRVLADLAARLDIIWVSFEIGRHIAGPILLRLLHAGPT